MEGRAVVESLEAIETSLALLAVSAGRGAGDVTSGGCKASGVTSELPLTLAALQAGNVSWQHARVMLDETCGLEPAAAAALEAHFLHLDDPNTARGCPAGELVPARFRAKARAWRERHHPESIETRHRKGVKTAGWNPSRTGTAWPGFRPTCPQTLRRVSGTGPLPPRAHSKAPLSPGP